MLLLLWVVFSVGTVPLLGGRLGRLGDLSFRSSHLLVATIALQVLIISVVPHWPHGLLAAGHVVSYLLAGTFILLNLKLAGVWLIGIGGMANMIAISINGGVMPASLDALRLAGLDAPSGFTNSTVVAAPKLSFLGDIFATPASWSISNTFSIGDVAIMLGAFLLIHRACGSRLFRPAASELPAPAI